jgi:hypothetical protein
MELEGVTDLSNVNDILTIPRGRPGLGVVKLDLREINRAQKRIPELGRATAANLSYLISDFTVGLSRLVRAISIVDMELKEAEMEYKQARSTALLIRVDDILKRYNQKSSADTRDAAVLLDKDVIDAKQRLDMLDVTSTFLRDTYNVLEIAYNGAKKIADAHMKLPEGFEFQTGGN